MDGEEKVILIITVIGAICIVISIVTSILSIVME